VDDQVPGLAVPAGAAGVVELEERGPGDEGPVAEPGEQGGVPGDGGQAGPGAGGDDGGGRSTCGVPEVCMPCDLRRRPRAPYGIMTIRVPAPALPHLRPDLRLDGPARPVIGLQ
jgi:hypothetical protein